VKNKKPFKCEVKDCKGETSGAFCDECTEYLITHQTFKAIVCKYCNCLVKFSESDKMEVELVEECSICRGWR